jgi:hypothetical protein
MYLLAGIMFSPAGETWWGDAGYYRIMKGHRIDAENVERASIGQVISDMQSHTLCEAIAAHYRKLA